MKIFKSSELSEKLKIKPVSVNELNHTYNYFPKTKQELYAIIKDRIEKEGNCCDLNDIDVSEIEDFSFIFSDYVKFNGNISSWDVSNVKTMKHMFSNCKKFNQNISSWNIADECNIALMFESSPLKTDKYRNHIPKKLQ